MLGAYQVNRDAEFVICIFTSLVHFFTNSSMNLHYNITHETKKKTIVLHRISVIIFGTSECVALLGKGFAAVINFSILT